MKLHHKDCIKLRGAPDCNCKRLEALAAKKEQKPRDWVLLNKACRV